VVSTSSRTSTGFSGEELVFVDVHGHHLLSDTFAKALKNYLLFYKPTVYLDLQFCRSGTFQKTICCPWGREDSGLVSEGFYALRSNDVPAVRGRLEKYSQ